MNARDLIVSVIGLGLSAGGCTMDPRLDQQARRRFEVSPSVADETNRDPYVEQGPIASAGAKSQVDAVQHRVRTAGQELGEATPAARAALPAPVAPATPSAPGVEWLSPNRFTLSSVPPRDQAAALRLAPPAPAEPGIDEARVPVEIGASAANQGTQIVRPLAPPAAPPAAASTAPPEPGPAAAHLAAAPPNGPANSSLHEGALATADLDSDPLGHKFAQGLRDYPADLAAHLDFQMLRFLRDEPVPQLDTISTLPSEDRELLTAVMDGLSNFRSGLRANKNMLLSQKAKPILDMADRVRSQAELTIPTIAICSRVQGFSVYDPMPTSLRAGVDNTVIIYCEVENFSSQQDDKGMWQTKLSQEAVLYNENGYTAWRDKSDVPVDLSRSRRHDFFLVKKVTLPRTLNIGRYSLKVSVFDDQVKRIAENSIPIELMAQ